jgi:hypothetical protein
LRGNQGEPENLIESNLFDKKRRSMGMNIQDDRSGISSLKETNKYLDVIKTPGRIVNKSARIENRDSISMMNDILKEQLNNLEKDISLPSGSKQPI